jgi:hypothetical protein
MTALQFLMTELDAPEFIDSRDEFTERYETVAYIMTKYAETEVKKLNKPVFSVKTTDEEIWHWVEWLDKRCAFTEHQQDYIFFAVRQILKKEAGATAKGGPAEDQAPAPKAD